MERDDGSPNTCDASSPRRRGGCSSGAGPGPSCRVCWGPAGKGESEQLLSPCDCIGSIQHVHAGCLARWQRQLWDAGHYRRALHCDVCRAPYAECCLRLLLDSGGPLLGALPALAAARAAALSLVADPQRALRAWRWCVLLGGLAAGTSRGLTGLRAGLALGVAGARQVAAATLRLAPRLGVVGVLLPASVPLLRSALRCSVAVMLAQVLLASAGGLLAGGALGFASGTAGVVRATALTGARGAALLAGAVARLTAGRQGSLLKAALLRGALLSEQPRTGA